MIIAAPPVCFDHLSRLTDSRGLFEHAELTTPRREHGYCVDDVARGLLVAVREPDPSDEIVRLRELYLLFVGNAQRADGRFHNRVDMDGEIRDEAGLGDCWGRALWGLGATFAHAPDLAMPALRCFERSASLRSPWARAMAFAGLGAAEVVSARPDHLVARALLADAAAMIGSPSADIRWTWPESRLRYANAALPEVLLAAGSLLGDAAALADGLAMLGWLVDVETSNDHLSVTPAGGWALGEARPGFDQQPIEVAALADACARAYDVDRNPRWLRVVDSCTRWFLGDNDSHVALIDPVSGGGCDGLERDGRNENQGAESTLALLSTFRQARRLFAGGTW